MNHLYNIVGSLTWLLHLAIVAFLAPFKWLHRKFTLWRLEPARKTLRDAYGHGRLSSNLLHSLDADILRRGGFSYALLFLIGCALLFGRATHAQLVPSAFQTGAPNFWRDDTNACPAPGLALTNSQLTTFTAGGTNSFKLTLRQDHGLGIFVTCISSNPTGGGTGYLGWDVASDGTKFTTKQPFWFTFPVPASASAALVTNVYYTNIDRTVLNNARSLQLTAASNSLIAASGSAGATVGNTNTIIVSLRYSYSVQ